MCSLLFQGELGFIARTQALIVLWMRWSRIRVSDKEIKNVLLFRGPILRDEGNADMALSDSNNPNSQLACQQHRRTRIRVNRHLETHVRLRDRFLSSIWSRRNAGKSKNKYHT
jgi:hypothetical protein